MGDRAFHGVVDAVMQLRLALLEAGMDTRGVRVELASDADLIRFGRWVTDMSLERYGETFTRSRIIRIADDVEISGPRPRISVDWSRFPPAPGVKADD